MSQTGGGAPGYTYSPDGRWWWDGRRWRPAESAPTPPGRPGIPRRLIAATVAIGLVLTATSAAAAAVIVYRVVHVPARPPLHAPPGHYLVAAGETGIERAATAQGLRCGSPPLVIGPAPRIRACHGTSANGIVSVQIIGFDASHVEVVEADVVAGRPVDESAAIAFLRSIIDAALPGDDAATADAWVGAHFNQGGTSRTVVNGVALQLVQSGPVRALSITPAP